MASTLWLRNGHIAGVNGNPILCAQCPCGPPSGIYVCGAFTHLGGGGAAINKIAYWNGSTWVGIGQPSGGTSVVHDIFYDSTRQVIIVGGDFTSISGVTAKNVAYWDGVNWNPMASGIFSTVYNIDQYPVGGPTVFGNDSNTVYAWTGGNVAPDGSTFGSPTGSSSDHVIQVYYNQGSNIFYAAVNNINRVYVWNGSGWSTRPVLNAATPDLFDGGLRTKALGDIKPTPFASETLVAITNVVIPPDTNAMCYEYLSGPGWADGGGTTAFAATGNTGAMALRSGLLYVGGRFNAGTIYVLSYFNGTWSTVTGGPNDRARVLRVHPTTNDLYAGGDFTSPGSRIASWNGSSWSALGAGFDGNVLGIAIIP